MDKKILIVEDDAQIRLLLKRILNNFTDHNVQIFTGKNGREGLEIAKSEKPDIMLVDVMMPIMDGLELCENIKTNPQLQHIYTIILTAKGQDYDIAKGKKAGANEYIIKPFSPDSIIARVENILNVGLERETIKLETPIILN